MLNAALSVQDAHAKALASFLFREIVEDAHEKYNIFQEDMKELRVWNGMIRRKRSSWRKKWMCCAPLLNRELPPARFGGAPGGVLISFNPWGRQGRWVQSFMRNFSDSLTADNVELVFVVFNKLYNSAVLVCELEFNINASVFVNINCVDQLDEQTARE